MLIRELELSDLSALFALEHAPDGLRLGTLAPMSSESQDGLRLRLQEVEAPSLWLGAFEGDALMAHLRIDRTPQARAFHSCKLSFAFLATAKMQAQTLLNDAITSLEQYAAIGRSVMLVPQTQVHAFPQLEQLLKRCGFVHELTQIDAYARGHAFERLRGYARVRENLPAAPSVGLPMPPRALQRPHVTIRASQVGDAGGFAAMMHAESIWENNLQIPYTNRKQWESVLGANASNGMHSWIAIAQLPGGEDAVASAVLLPQHDARMRHRFNFGIGVHEQYQGVGIGGDLTRHVLAFADAELGARRVDLGVLSTNARAIALYEKCGFVIEGIERGKAFVRGGYGDYLYMARITAA